MLGAVLPQACVELARAILEAVSLVHNEVVPGDPAQQRHVVGAHEDFIRCQQHMAGEAAAGHLHHNKAPIRPSFKAGIIATLCSVHALGRVCPPGLQRAHAESLWTCEGPRLQSQASNTKVASCRECLHSWPRAPFSQPLPPGTAACAGLAPMRAALPPNWTAQTMG